MRFLGWGVSAMVLAALLSAAVVGGCTRPGVDGRSAGLVVRRNGTVLAGFALPQLAAFPQVEIATPQSHGAQVQRGPSVRSVLHAAGAGDVAGVRVEGRDPPQTLTVTELDDRVILDITKRNTLKLAGPDLGVDRWVRDVTALVVNP